MSQVALTARPRPASKGSARRARRAGAVPAVLYGRGGENLRLEIGARDLRKALSTEAGENVVIALAIEGGGAGETVMVKEIQIDPVTHAPIHADLIRIDVTRTVRVKVPVETTGIAVGVAEGGILQVVLHEVEIESLPTTIPASIRVDVTGLAIGHSIHVSDLPVPAGVSILADPGAAVVTVTAPKSEEAVSAVAAPTEPERIGEKKEEEGEAAEGEAAEAPEKKAEKRVEKKEG